MFESQHGRVKKWYKASKACILPVTDLIKEEKEMNVPKIIPFHNAYPRPQGLTPQKKNTTLTQTATFQEILKKKMNQKQ
jgi:hypothetical protein